MAKKKSSNSVVHYTQRLFEDEYVQGQLRDAAAGIRSAYGRVRKRPAQAAEDKKLHRNVRQAAISMRKALTALRRSEPEPEPKHRFRAVLIATAVIAGSVLIISRRGSRAQPAGGISAEATSAVERDGAPMGPAQPETTSSPSSD